MTLEAHYELEHDTVAMLADAMKHFLVVYDHPHADPERLLDALVVQARLRADMLWRASA
jgi:hypothetical protein